MKALIQRFPSALLSLLSIKQSETPNYIPDEVHGAIEMVQFYTADRVEVQRAFSLAVSAASVQVNLPVPAGEYWLVHAIAAAAVNVTAGSVVKIGCGIADQAGLVITLQADQAPSPASLAGETYTKGQVFGPPILLKPGMQLFGLLLADPGVGTVDLFISALVSRMTPNA